jgi:hypothetical protein
MLLQAAQHFDYFILSEKLRKSYYTCHDYLPLLFKFWIFSDFDLIQNVKIFLKFCGRTYKGSFMRNIG